MIKQIPILFSTAMVQAILAGRKSVTRRIVNGGFDPNQYSDVKIIEHASDMLGLQAYFSNTGDANAYGIKCPYGKVGDVLYVRESYYQFGNWREVTGVKTKKGRTKWEFVPQSELIVFGTEQLEGEIRKGRHHKDPYTMAWHKRLPRFMPKKYARTWLEVTEVNVEPLQDISTADIEREGIGMEAIKGADRCVPASVHLCQEFKNLWESINGAESWDANPWVWVVRFKVLSTTGKPDGL